MPTLDGYILRAFLVPFFILLFAFTLLFIITDMYNDVGDFLDNKASLPVTIQYFLLKIPGNILFILPITVLLACMYALANLGRTRELTAIRASGISLGRCGMPIFVVGFCVMLVNFYFNERLVPQTSRQAEIVRRTVNNEKFVEESNARLQFHSGDHLRSWYFGQFDDDGYQESVRLKFYKKTEQPEKSTRFLDSFLAVFGYIPTQNMEASKDIAHVILAEKTYFDETISAWVFFKPIAGRIEDNKLYAIFANEFADDYKLTANIRYSDYPRIREGGTEFAATSNAEATGWLVKNYASWPEDEKTLVKVLAHFAKTLPKTKENQDIAVPEHIPVDEAARRTFLSDSLKTFAAGRVDDFLTTVEFEDVNRMLHGKLDLSQGKLDILAFYDNEAEKYDFKAPRTGQESAGEASRPDVMRDKLYWEKNRDPILLVVSDRFLPDKPSVIVKSVVEPEALSSIDIFTILRDNPNMASNLRRIYWTIFFNRLAYPWACFLCAFFAFPLATRNERSGIFTAIATAVGIAVLYQVLNEVFMVAGKAGYLPPFLAGLTPTVVFGAYGIYLLKKAG